MKYVNVRKYLKYCCPYIMLIGERSNGKTYSCLDFALEDYFTFGNEFFIVRRWDDNLKKGGALKMFENVINDGKIKKYSKGKYESMEYRAHQYYFTKYNENSEKIIDMRPSGYAYGINIQEEIKSLAFPRVVNVIFDEFITNKLYMADEFYEFQNLLSTIFRLRENVRVFMCGNTINKYCPYFAEMGLTRIKDMKPGDVDIYTYGESKLKVCVVMTEDTSSLKPNNYLFAFDNPKLKMITAGAWAIDIHPHLPFKYNENEVKFKFFLEFDNELLVGNIIKHNKDMILFFHRKTTSLKNLDKDILISNQIMPRKNHITNLIKSTHPIAKAIYGFFRNDKVFYQNNEIGDIVKNYLNCCKKY